MKLLFARVAAVTFALMVVVGYLLVTQRIDRTQRGDVHRTCEAQNELRREVKAFVVLLTRPSPIPAGTPPDAVGRIHTANAAKAQVRADADHSFHAIPCP